MRGAGGFDSLEADETPDAVIDVDDEIAGAQRGGFRQHVLGAPLTLALTDQAVAENILLAEHGEIFGLEAMLQRDHRERHRARPGGFHLRVRGDEFVRFQPVVGEHMAQPLPRTVRPAGDDHRLAGGAQRPQMRDRRLEHVDVLVLPLRREIPARPAAAVDHVERLRRRLERLQPRGRPRLQGRRELRRRKVEPVRFQRLVVVGDGVLLARVLARASNNPRSARSGSSRHLQRGRRAPAARRRGSRTACRAFRRTTAANVRGRWRAGLR